MASLPNSIQWLIKTQTGKQIGPYSTEAILKLIADGTLTGTEQIKRYPDGRWTAISRQPAFYDELLEALEEVKNKRPKGSQGESSKKTSDEDMTLTREPEEQEQDDETVIVPWNPLENKREPSESVVTPVKVEGRPLPQRETLSMTPIHRMKQKKKSQSMLLPVILLLAAAGLGYFALQIENQPQKSIHDKPHLLQPKISTNTVLSSDEIKKRITAAVGFFVQDTYESYVEAENKLVSVIEGAPQNLEARGTLCLVYKELWPYVKQDTQDLDAVNALHKSTRSLDPLGVNGVYCEISKLMIQGKYREARGAVEYALNQPALATAPVLYSLKAELLFEDRDVNSAILYTEKAAQLWPEWILPRFNLGKYSIRANRPGPAVKALLLVLKQNPLHKLAQIEYGILLYKGFQQTEEALKILSSTMSSKGLISRLEEARGEFVLSQIYVEKKDFVSAKTSAQKAYELNPADAMIKDLLVQLGGSTEVSGKAARNNELVFIGDQHFRTGNCMAAQAEYKAAFDLDPTNAVAAMKAAKCLWQLNQGMEAIGWLNKAIKAEPKLISAYVLKADYLSSRYDFISATQTLNKATQIVSNNYEVLRGYGQIDYRRNNLKEAIAYLQRAYKIYENDLETLILLAKSHAANGDFTSAQKYSVRAIELDPSNSDAQIVYAQILTQFKGLDTGLVYLRDLINRFSYTIEFRLALGDMYRQQDRHIQAQRVYEQIIDANPKDKKAHLGLGLALQGQALFDPALKEYLTAAVIDPSDAEGLFRAGQLYLETGKYGDAIRQFRRALEVNRLYPRLQYSIGRAHFLSGQYDQALAASMEERKLNPNLAESYLLAAEIYSSTKQFQKCATEYQQAVKLRPQADIYVKIARCYRQSGSPDIAESMLNIAASQESGLPEIYREQGAIYETRGDQRAAVQAYNKYLTLSPNAPDRHEIEGIISSIGRGK
ncbi:MAG: hypothetical protein COT73_06120 [Bdellovibrio sp. CG10_big_fil_rev_8_21_14_0_10_47_8]|nr:MAG: hypothetical protein COT73_06120 [Bdellovibrio sp. CG10_big_fil_rev_8_21_14_0_10_47_8]